MSDAEEERAVGSERTALIVIDVLNRFEHDDAEPLIASVRETAPQMQAAVARAREAGVPVVYVNDNYGDWSAGGRELSELAMAGPEPTLIEPLLPPEGAAFMTKARHSAFYETQLDYYLRSEGIRRIVLVGQVTEQCILYSALDGYVRHYEVVVPRDAVAHIHPDLAAAALRMMELNMRAAIVRADELFGRADAPFARSGHG